MRASLDTLLQIAVMTELGGGGVAPPHFADQLTLFKPRGEADSTPSLLPAPKIFSASGITVIVYHFRSSMQCDDNEKIDPGISGTALMGLNAQLPC